MQPQNDQAVAKMDTARSEDARGISDYVIHPYCPFHVVSVNIWQKVPLVTEGSASATWKFHVCAVGLLMEVMGSIPGRVLLKLIPDIVPSRLSGTGWSAFVRVQRLPGSQKPI
jgi:hypothetical protein